VERSAPPTGNCAGYWAPASEAQRTTDRELRGLLGPRERVAEERWRWLLGAGADGDPVLGHARRTSASAFAGIQGGCATARGAPIGPDPNNGRFFSSLLVEGSAFPGMCAG